MTTLSQFFFYPKSTRKISWVIWCVVRWIERQILPKIIINGWYMCDMWLYKASPNDRFILRFAMVCHVLVFCLFACLLACLHEGRLEKWKEYPRTTEGTIIENWEKKGTWKGKERGIKRNCRKKSEFKKKNAENARNRTEHTCKHNRKRKQGQNQGKRRENPHVSTFHLKLQQISGFNNQWGKKERKLQEEPRDRNEKETKRQC